MLWFRLREIDLRVELVIFRPFTHTPVIYIGQLSMCAPSLIPWSDNSLIFGNWVWLGELVVYFVHFGSLGSIYCHLEPPTHLYFLTHTCLGLIIVPPHLTNVHIRFHDRFGWVGYSLVHLGGIEVKSHHDTCTFPIGFQSLMNFVQCIINVYHNIYKMYSNNMISN